MAKKKKSDSEKDLDNINTALDSILQNYKVIPKKEQKALLKELKKGSKKEWKEFAKTNDWRHRIAAKGFDSRAKKIANQTERIFINYGIFDLHVKADYLASVKDKEQYLDGLFNRRMKAHLGNTELKTVKDAKVFESLVTQYTKKIKSTKFYDVELVENSINKLTNFRNKVNNYDYSFFINEKRQRVQGEVYEKRQKDNIKELKKELKIATKNKDKKVLKNIKKDIKEIEKDIKENYISESEKSIKRQIADKKKSLKSKRVKEDSKIDIQGEIDDLEEDYLSLENDDANLIDSEESTIEQKYKAVEKPITIDGFLMGIQFNFF